MALNELDKMEDMEGSPSFQFMRNQLSMILTPKNNLRFSKSALIFAAELLCISPAAYRMIRSGGAMCLPREQLIRELMSLTFNDDNLNVLLKSLSPEQRFLNLLFDEVKLKSALRYSAGHIMGHATNDAHCLATSALTIEVVCHHGGPRFILRVLPVAKLTSVQLKGYIVESLEAVARCGGRPVSLICDNCPVNQKVYSDLGGPGAVIVPSLGYQVYLVFDFVHIFKNIRNNWITEKSQELLFMHDNSQYTARWKDICDLYNSDSSSSVRFTKLTHTAVYPKTLQRQSVALVSKVFNYETCAALRSLRNQLRFEEGTLIFVEMITEWFKMMNVKDNFAAIRCRDDSRLSWSRDCVSFQKLMKVCDMVGSCRWDGIGTRCKKITKFTADAFVVTTKNNIAAAQMLLHNHNFSYVLPSVFSQDPIEKFFGQARQRFGGNYYIDIGDVIAAAKVQQLHQLIKHDIVPHTSKQSACDLCKTSPAHEDMEHLSDIMLEDTQQLLSSDDVMKHKIVYIAGFITHKFLKHVCDDTGDDLLVSSEYLDELNRGGLMVPTLSTCFFVHSAIYMFPKLLPERSKCREYLSKILFLIDAEIAANMVACRTVANIIMKAHVLDNSDREQQLGCLRRKEKLQ